MIKTDNVPVKIEFPPTPGVLLAGGLARRMGGGDKPMRQIGGRTILARVIARLQPQCDGLILNANGDPARFAAFGLPVIADTVENFPGPLAGILAALDWAAANRPEVEFILSAAADCPFLPRDLVARLHQARIAEGRAARGRGVRRTVASGDRIVERRLARRASPRAGRGRYPQDRPLDRALQARDRDVAGGAARSVLQCQHHGRYRRGGAVGGAGWGSPSIERHPGAGGSRSARRCAALQRRTTELLRQPKPACVSAPGLPPTPAIRNACTAGRCLRAVTSAKS